MRIRNTWQLVWGKVLCLTGHHNLDSNCNGWTGDEWVCCTRCLRAVEGTLKVWDGILRQMRYATQQEWSRFLLHSEKTIPTK